MSKRNSQPISDMQASAGADRLANGTATTGWPPSTTGQPDATTAHSWTAAWQLEATTEPQSAKFDHRLGAALGQPKPHRPSPKPPSLPDCHPDLDGKAWLDGERPDVIDLGRPGD